MLNMIKADLYRIFHGKGIYITIGLLIIIWALQILPETFGTIGMNIEDLNEVETVTQLTGMNTPLKVMESTDNYLYFLLALIVFVAATDFSSGTAKNALSNGMSRVKYYFSKLILSSIFCVVLVLVSIIVPTFFVTLKSGFGGSIDSEYIFQLLKAVALQLFMFLSVTSVGVFLAFTTKRTVAVNGFYIAFCLVPMLIIVILMNVSDKFMKLLKYDVVMNIRSIAHIDVMTQNDVTRVLIIGSVYLLLSTMVGLLIFRKGDIK